MTYFHPERLIPPIVFAIGLAFVTLVFPQSPQPVADKSAAAEIDVHFSPKGGCEAEVVKQIGNAKKELLVQCYSFTDGPICNALIKANKDGVSVKVIFDKSDWTGKGELVQKLVKAGVPCWMDSKHAIAHNKIMVIDEKTVLTGSFNFTTNAEQHNAENLLTIHDKNLALRYRDNWLKHQDHSEKK